jgi:hypothetical protein
MVSGNELFAELVYPRYGSFFSAGDIAQMTWDRSHFWDNHLTETTGTVVLPGPEREPVGPFGGGREEAAFWGCALLPGPGCGADLGFQDLSPVFGLGTKRDIRQIDSIANKVRLSPEQRRMLHDELQEIKRGGGDLSHREIEEVAREIKRNFPNK